MRSKKLLSITILAAAFSYTLRANAHAYESKIYSVEKSEIFANISGQGSLSLNTETRSIEVVLYQKFNCPNGKFCAQVMPRPLVFSFEIDMIQRDSCGNLHVSAHIPKLDSNSRIEAIELVDHKNNLCPAWHPAPVEVIFYPVQPYNFVRAKAQFLNISQDEQKKNQFKTDIQPIDLSKNI